jgi:hypothetical protein
VATTCGTPDKSPTRRGLAASQARVRQPVASRVSSARRAHCEGRCWLRSVRGGVLSRTTTRTTCLKVGSRIGGPDEYLFIGRASQGEGRLSASPVSHSALRSGAGAGGWGGVCGSGHSPPPCSFPVRHSSAAACEALRECRAVRPCTSSRRWACRRGPARRRARCCCGASQSEPAYPGPLVTMRGREQWCLIREHNGRSVSVCMAPSRCGCSMRRTSYSRDRVGNGEELSPAPRALITQESELSPTRQPAADCSRVPMPPLVGRIGTSARRARCCSIGLVVR